MYHPQVLFVKIVKFPRAGNVGATKVIFWEQPENKQHNIIVMLLILSNTHVSRAGCKESQFYNVLVASIMYTYT